MKKGKPRPYVKKESKTKDKLMILIVAAVMVVSGVYFAGIQHEEAGNKKTVSVKSYGIGDAVDNAYALVAEKRPEIVAMLGDRATARLTQETIEELLNVSTGTVYHVEAEEAVNSFVLFRFYAVDSRKALDGLKPLLNQALGDYTMYGVYTGVQPGGASEDVRMELFCPVNVSLNTGALVRILLLKREYTQPDGSSAEEFFGFVKNTIPFGPKVKAIVSGIDGLAVWGLTGVEQDVYELNKSVRGVEAAYQPPYILVNGLVEEPDFNVTGVKLTLQGNYTIIELENASLEEEAAGLLKGLGLNHTLVEGTVTLSLPLGANLSRVKEMLAGMNITNLTVQKLGRTTLPEEVAMENMLVPISNNRNASSVLFLNATVGDEIDVSLMAIRLGDQYIVNARQV